MPDIAADGVSIHHGFPNPAENDLNSPSLALDLNKLVIKHPSSSYLFRVVGHRWSDQGIHDSDIAVIDRSLEPKAGSLVVSWQNDSFYLYRYKQLDKAPIWGVVAALVRHLNS